MSGIENRLQKVLERTVDAKNVFGTSFCVKHKDFTWCGTSGNFQKDEQYFIASTTKLFVTAIILNLRSKNIISFDDRISAYLTDDILNGLHTLNGTDYSSGLTIKNLLAHTSGIPDYFQQKDGNGKSLEKELVNGNDRSWSFEEAIALSKTLKPLFIPDQKRKAHYSDTNFQLLGRIIENSTQISLSDNFEELIFKPLHLTKTYLYQDNNDKTPKVLFYKNRELIIPKAMSSFGADGGVVSTSKELLQFIEAFFSGGFFPAAYISELQVWNNIFFPLQSGIGIQRFKLPWIFNPFGNSPELIGHSGLSGALAFYNPKNEIFISGTVNQVANPGISFRLVLKIIQHLLKK
ncbi:serine hydrolase domain-containing protein [Maribacter halichondriae]|uniref:serine hydrolase domain-containing protein n=1 Tax=Maribacter halichondriae TaxID=2980554 RepID=UPI0023587253|nr:serine hydrolase domain-containing protein [Maribacter sp. Hal144]